MKYVLMTPGEIADEIVKVHKVDVEKLLLSAECQKKKRVWLRDLFGTKKGNEIWAEMIKPMVH